MSWQGQEAPAAVRRSRGTTIALVAAAAFAVAAHLVAGGVAWRWTSVAADVLLGLVVLKIVVVAVFARHRFRGHGSRTPGSP